MKTTSKSEAILSYVALNPKSDNSKIVQGTKIGKETVRTTLIELVQNGKIVSETEGKKKVFTVVSEKVKEPIKKSKTVSSSKEINSEAMMILAPSAYAKEAHSSRSKKYTFIPTSQILDDFAKKGWVPHFASERKTLKAENAGFQQHLIRLRNANYSKLDVAGYIPELLLTNSHDGRSSFRIYAALHGFLRENTLIVSDKSFASVGILHKGYTQEQVFEACDKLVDTLPTILNSVQKFQKQQLNDKEILKFAKDAATVRWGKEMADTIDLKTMVTGTKDEDKKKDVWTVYNVVQNNIITGGIGINGENGKSRKSKGLDSIPWVLKVNKGLWDLAAETSTKGE